MKEITFPEFIVGGFIALIAAWGIGYGMGKEKARGVAEPPAAQVRQADASLILQRNPPEKPPELPQIPPKAKVMRITTVHLLPSDPVTPDRPVETIQLTQIQTAEGSRVIASSPDGRILGGSDWTEPVGPPARVYRWQLQAVRSWDQNGRGTWGGAVGYTRGPMVGTVTVLPGCIQAAIGVRW